jgi:hypothetical protein
MPIIISLFYSNNGSGCFVFEFDFLNKKKEEPDPDPVRTREENVWQVHYSKRKNLKVGRWSLMPGSK